MDSHVRQLRRFALFALLLWGAGASFAYGALHEFDLDAMTRRSSIIVRGKVSRMESGWGYLGRHGPVLMTDVTIDVSETWKGSLKTRRITVRLLGGRIGERWQVCPDSPRYTVGEDVLVFARTWKGTLWTTGWQQGKYRVVRDATGTKVAGKPRCPLDRPTDLQTVRDRVRAILWKVSASGAPAASAVTTKPEVTR